MKGYVAIVLVNSNALICNWCEVNSPNKLQMLANCIFCPATQSDYCGHYVVLCGFDADKRCVYYKNPSFDESLCCAKFDMFESARHSYGTDDDIIFIKLEEPQLNMKEILISNSSKLWLKAWFSLLWILVIFCILWICLFFQRTVNIYNATLCGGILNLTSYWMEASSRWIKLIIKWIFSCHYKPDFTQALCTCSENMGPQKALVKIWRCCQIQIGTAASAQIKAPSPHAFL